MAIGFSVAALLIAVAAIPGDALFLDGFAVACAVLTASSMAVAFGREVLIVHRRRNTGGSCNVNIIAPSSAQNRPVSARA